MSLFSYSTLDALKDLGEATLNSMTAPMYRGDIQRIFSGVSLTENGSSHNEFVLGPGEHQGFLLEKPLAALWGQPGALVTGVAQIKASSKIEGVVFKQTNDSKNTSNLVVISSPAKVVFSNCIFQRQSNAASSNAAASELCFVLVNSGAKAVFSNCVFQSNLTNGAMDTVAGLSVQDLNAAPGSVFVGTGANYSTHPHAGTVTSLGGEIS